MADTTEAAAAGHDAAGAAAGHAAEAVGMPQLDFSTFPNQIFWLVVALVAIYYILTKIALPRIEGILADRHAAISNDVAAAEELKAKVRDAEAAYEKALADARAESARIAEIRASAVESVEAVAKDTAAALVQALGFEAGDDRIAAAVSGQLKG